MNLYQYERELERYNEKMQRDQADRIEAALRGKMAPTRDGAVRLLNERRRRYGLLRNGDPFPGATGTGRGDRGRTF